MGSPCHEPGGNESVERQAGAFVLDFEAPGIVAETASLTLAPLPGEGASWLRSVMAVATRVGATLAFATDEPVAAPRIVARQGDDDHHAYLHPPGSGVRARTTRARVWTSREGQANLRVPC